MDINKKRLHDEYKHLQEVFGAKGGLWTSMMTHFSPAVFCEGNRAAIIAEYLIWKDFVRRAKEIGFIYYYGIDQFLEAYKNAVESRINLD